MDQTSVLCFCVCEQPVTRRHNGEMRNVCVCCAQSVTQLLRVYCESASVISSALLNLIFSDFLIIIVFYSVVIK